MTPQTTANIDQLDSAVGETEGSSFFWNHFIGIWIGCHLLVWTVLPCLVQPNLPLDAVEMLYIGHEWPLGHFKHPTLPGWLAETASILTGNSEWAIYLLSQLMIVTAFWAAWQLGREILKPRTAVLSAALLECCYYYNINSTEFNNSITMLAFWALAVLFFHWALTRKKKRYWIAIGLALGLGMLAKYTIAVLAGVMLLYMLIDRDARQHWKSSGPYLTLLTTALVFSPHLYWVLTNDYGPIQYALNRTTSEKSNFFTRFLYPISFAGAQAVALFPILLVITPMAGWRGKLRSTEETDPSVRRFLNAMVFGPPAIYLVLSLVGNLYLRGMHGWPLWTFLGVWLLYNLKLDESEKARRQVAFGIIAIGIILAGFFAVRNVASPMVRKKASRVHFPSESVAQAAHDAWAKVSDEPLPMIAGQWWPAANVSYYGPRRVTVYGGRYPETLDFQQAFSAWTNDDTLKASGGIIIWEEIQKFPTEEEMENLHKRFPNLQILPTMEFQPEAYGDLPPVRINMGLLLPPEKQQ